MTSKQLARTGARAAAAAIAAGAAADGADAAVTWFRYGLTTPAEAAEADALLEDPRLSSAPMTREAERRAGRA
jgi:hypothetical protein